MPAIELTKHHGLGNDFLVVFTDQRLPRLPWSHIARQVCDRRRGIGADGLIVATPPTAPGAPLTMSLFNADGSGAEMSGNGIRCLAQAWARREGQVKGQLVVHTEAGSRLVRFGPDGDSRSLSSAVDMGTVTVIDAPPGWDELGVDGARPVAHLSVGNPHTVVAVDDVGGELDLVAIGQRLPDVNLEIVHAGPEPDAVTMRVHERGVGVTEACGTGACAAGWAAARWGLVRPGTEEITVHMDGGDAKVVLDAPGPGRVTLVGPATFVGTVVCEV
jgi:diaminopimelate epimerase